MGRPLSANPKDKMIRFRADKSTVDKLDECAKALGTSRSDVIRKGIDKVAEGIKGK